VSPAAAAAAHTNAWARLFPRTIPQLTRKMRASSGRRCQMKTMSASAHTHTHTPMRTCESLRELFQRSVCDHSCSLVLLVITLPPPHSPSCRAMRRPCSGLQSPSAALRACSMQQGMRRTQTDTFAHAHTHSRFGGVLAAAIARVHAH
jgi:hypothetical protein